MPGLQVQILAFADRLQIFNHTGRTVTIYGYQGEPYARLLADGTVQLNERSPALYLNTSFYGGGVACRRARTRARRRSGRRCTRPARSSGTTTASTGPRRRRRPQVKDKGKRTLIFNWTVPISVGGPAARSRGQLFWAAEHVQGLGRSPTSCSP